MKNERPTIRVANGAGFLGDQIAVPRRLVESTELDYLTLEYLAELTLSILARQRQKDDRAGFATDFVEVLSDINCALAGQPQLHVVTNAGGVNPISCATHAASVLSKAGLADLPLGVLTGDDLTSKIGQLQHEGCPLANLDTGQPLDELQKPVVTANAYLGAGSIVTALEAQSRIVITGRVADASLTVGPAVHAFGWADDDWSRLAAATVAGHLIECGAQMTGGYSTSWREYDLTDVGYPIAELSDDGTTVVTKPLGTGGRVSRQTVVEQLVYEIGDPRHYLTPDLDVDFTTVEVAQEGPDRVGVRGASGGPPPDTYKVSLAYEDGYAASGQLLIFGRDCIEKAKACADMVLTRVARAGYDLAQSHVEYLGTGSGVPGRMGVGEDHPSALPPAKSSGEIVLRIAVADPRREAVERFAKELAPLITSGPAGVAGYATARSSVRPVLAFWPTVVPKELVQPKVDVRPARDWTESRTK